MAGDSNDGDTGGGNARLLETGNDALAESLLAKVQKIKHITIDMDDRIMAQNDNLDDMSMDMQSLTGTLLECVNAHVQTVCVKICSSSASQWRSPNASA